MKHIAFIKQSLLLVAGALAVMLTSCIKDDLAECSKLTLKVEGLNGGEILDITRLGLVTDATLYIFDANKNFLEAGYSFWPPWCAAGRVNTSRFWKEPREAGMSA